MTLSILISTEQARQGAELIAWPTQSPQTSQPAFRAKEHRCYIVSSTWRHNASIFEPTGKIAAQIKPPQSILVHELDLSYALRFELRRHVSRTIH